MTDLTQNLFRALLGFKGRVIDRSYSCWSDIEGLVKEANRRNDYFDDDVRVSTVYSVDLLAAYPSIRNERLDMDKIISQYDGAYRQNKRLTNKVYEVSLMLYQERGEKAYVVSIFNNLLDGAEVEKQYYLTDDLNDAMRQYDVFVDEFVGRHS